MKHIRNRNILELPRIVDRSMTGGILTFHRNNNPGSIMQAYCLSRFLDIPIIDFTYPERLEAIHRLCYLPGDKSCLEWSEKKLPTTNRLRDENEAVEFINSLDFVVIGSDEVWKHGDVHGQNLLCTFPNLYFGHKITCKKIAYAASLGHKSHLGSKEVACLDRFDILSVRDQLTFDAIKNVSNDLANRTILIPDPTFAIKFFKPSSKKYGVKWLESGLVHTNSLLDSPLNPIQWFEAVSRLQYALTRRMHGLIACLLGNTPVSVICDRPKTLELFKSFSLDNGRFDSIVIHSKIKEYRKKHESFRKFIKIFLD